MDEHQEKQKEAYGGLIKKYPKLGVPILFLAGSWVLYHSVEIHNRILLLEQGKGESIRIPRFLIVVYDLVGIWGVILAFVLGGFYLYYLTYDVYRKLVKK